MPKRKRKRQNESTLNAMGELLYGLPAAPPLPQRRGMIKWGEAKMIEGSLRQHAWHDETDWSVPVELCEGVDPAEGMRAAAEAFRQSRWAQGTSGFGALRWVSGREVKEVDVEGRRLIVTEHVRLCD